VVEDNGPAVGFGVVTIRTIKKLKTPEGISSLRLRPRKVQASLTADYNAGRLSRSRT
jgi:hypothetical protein